MPVTFRDITHHNFEQVIGLELKDEQQGFVRSNRYSIAQAKAIPVLTPRAVYNESDELVGFVLYRGECDPTEDPDGWLVRIMSARSTRGAATAERLWKR
jgi:diamine N-acetyltransferase